MSGWFDSRPARDGDEGSEAVAAAVLAVAGVALALYLLLRILGGEALGGLAAGASGGLVLGCVAARADEPAGAWSGAALICAVVVVGVYALVDPGTLAPQSHALALLLAAGAALLVAAPAILVGERLQLNLWRSGMRRDEKRRLRERMDRDARSWREGKRRERRRHGQEHRR